MSDLWKIAHNSGDGITIFHCPLCGSGSVVARSDNSVECQFCGVCFSVQIQPQFAAFPQTINGVPVQVPGVPPDPTMGGAAAGQQAPGAPGGPSGMPDAPAGQEDPDAEEGDGEDEEDEESSQGPQPGGNPFTSSLKTFADFIAGH